MAESNLAENTFDQPDPLEALDRPDNQRNEAQNEEEYKRKLSPSEVKDLEEKRTTIRQLETKREELKAKAETRLKELSQVTGIFSKTALLSPKEQIQLQRELEDTHSPQKIQEMLDKLQELPKNKEEAAKNAKKEREPDDPELLKLQEKFDKLCDDNKNALEDPKKFKDWFTEERKKKPTIEHLEKLLYQNENDERGDTIAKRRVTYNKLSEKFKKYNLHDDPGKNPWIKANGIKERELFLKKIEELEKHFDTRKDTGFYSPEMIKKRIQENLIGKNPDEIDQNLKIAQKIASKEDEAFTYFDQTITVGGISVKKMSDASKKELLSYYKDATFAEREKVDFRAMVENEGKLAQELEKIYTDEKTKILDKEGLKLALGSFEHLDFLKKQAALETHKELVKNSESKEARDRELTLKAAHTKIDDAAEKKIISPGGEQSTQGRYKQFFNDPNNFKNAKTGKPGDVEEMKKAYEILISPTSQEKYKNLAAYKANRELFKKDLKKLQELNPNIAEEEIRKWQEKYDQGSWTDREHIRKTEFPSELFKQKLEQQKRRQIEEKVGLKEKDKDKEKVVSLELSKTIKEAQELIANNQAAEAMKLLLAYNEKEPDNQKILFWMETTARYMKEFGTGKKREATIEKELEQELKKMATSDESLRRDLQEEQIKTLNIKGARQSEERHQRKISARERAKAESLDHTASGTLERDLTESAYEQMGKKFTLDKEGRGEELTTIQFKENVPMQQEMIQKLRRETYKKQTKLDTKEGMIVELKDKEGKTISAEMAERLQKAELGKMEKKMAEKAQENVKKRHGQMAAEGGAKAPGAQIFDIQTRIAARRKAEEISKKHREEKFKQAA